MAKSAKGNKGGPDLEKIIEGEAEARSRGFRDAIPAGQIPNKRGYEPPERQWNDEDGGSRLRVMMREYARRNGGEWPYF